MFIFAISVKALVGAFGTAVIFACRNNLHQDVFFHDSTLCLMLQNDR